jgi:hypothetical protein
LRFPPVDFRAICLPQALKIGSRVKAPLSFRVDDSPDLSLG